MTGTAATTAVRWPAEWERHEATWLAWPHHEPDWPGKFGPIPWVWAEIVRALHAHERVEIICHDEAVRENARHCLDMHDVRAEGYRLHVAPTDRVWMRDSGPTGVLNARGEVELVHWAFNAWAKYDNYSNDAALGSAVAQVSALTRHEPQRPDGRQIYMNIPSVAHFEKQLDRALVSMVRVLRLVVI